MNAAYGFLLMSLILERIFDPLLAIPACAAGLACRRWWHLAAAAAIIGGLFETARYVSNFQPALLAVTWVAAFAWGSLVLGIKRLVRRRAGLSGKALSW